MTSSKPRFICAASPIANKSPPCAMRSILTRFVPSRWDTHRHNGTNATESYLGIWPSAAAPECARSGLRGDLLGVLRVVLRRGHLLGHDAGQTGQHLTELRGDGVLLA